VLDWIAILSKWSLRLCRGAFTLPVGSSPPGGLPVQIYPLNAAGCDISHMRYG
jgi:hypothetical protein